MQSNRKNNYFITLKDHKENFLNDRTVGLTNPAKIKLGGINKDILEKTNVNIREVLTLNLRKNTETAIDWFKSI